MPQVERRLDEALVKMRRTKTRLGIATRVTGGTRKGGVGEVPVGPLGHRGMGILSVKVGLHFSIKVKFIWHKITHRKMASGVTFCGFRILSDHSFCLFQNMFVTPKVIPIPSEDSHLVSNNRSPVYLAS